jgi:hypothetical protein
MTLSIAEMCFHSPFKIITCLDVFEGIFLPVKMISIHLPFVNLTQNKRRKDDSNYLAFLLSFDLRDYPLKMGDFPPSVSNPER